MFLSLSQSLYEAMLQNIRENLPNEACGYLVGERMDSGLLKVRDHYALTNIDRSPEHFSMDRDEQIQAYQKTQEQGFVFLSCYHSHPQTPARPSVEDMRLAYDPQLVYTIVSVKDGEDQPVMKAYDIKKKEVKEGGAQEDILEEMPWDDFKEKDVVIRDHDGRFYQVHVSQINVEIVK